MISNLWELSGSSDPLALSIVDGTGDYEDHGPHYSRRTPGSRTFTGVGQEIVLTHPSGAVWAVVRQRVPAPAGSGSSRGRIGVTKNTAYVWRNMMFRNLGTERSSDLIRSAVIATVREWQARYGELPIEDLRTEVNSRMVKSEVAGYCYRRAGWVKIEKKRAPHMIYLRCPRAQILRAMEGNLE